MNFHGEALPRTEHDIDEAARLLNVSAAHILAVLDVEARGKGFLRDGRPIILFEPHVFYRELPRNQRAAASRRGVACRSWGQIRYPRSVSGSYDRLETAMKINRNAALKSCSWGIGQVMGFNHAAAGYGNVISFVEAMKLSEGAQIMAMMCFIRTHKLDEHLRRGDWRGFARGYNGSGYEKNRYHTKLASAYAAHSKSRRVAAGQPATGNSWLGLGSIGDEVRDLQTALNVLGANIKVDGDFGPATREALQHAQRRLGLRPDGLFGNRSKEAITDALERKTAV